MVCVQTMPPTRENPGMDAMYFTVAPHIDGSIFDVVVDRMGTDKQ